MNTQRDSFLSAAIHDRFAGAENHPQYQVWLDYAMSTNARGAEILQTIHKIIPSVRGKRYLDIGCGYGGSCIAFASEGAEVVGIDYDESLLNIAQANYRDHPDLNISFKRVDVMDANQVNALGKFDLITSDNVIEHVKDPGRLIAFCRQLITINGIVYLTVPNAYSLGQIRKDCHYALPGISLLDPDDATVYVKYALNQPFYDVSWYYHYHTFEHLFMRYGFSEKLLNSYQVSEEDITRLQLDYEQLFEELKNLSGEGKFPPEIGQRILYRLQHHINMLETDILYAQAGSDAQSQSVHRDRIFRDYHTELWCFILHPLTDPGRGKPTPGEFYSTADILGQLSGREMLKILGRKLLLRLKLLKRI